MTRSALVIGLGGTGSWVLTYLKQELVHLHGGAVPGNIQLLTIDTDRETRPRDVPSIQGYGTAVALEPSLEVVNLIGDIWPLIEDIRRGHHPELANWFDAESWLKFASRSWAELAHGSGGQRWMGRLALQMDLQRGAYSVTRAALQRALHVCNERGDASPLAIFVVASLVGGTGSALVVDVVQLLNDLDRTKNHDVIGFLVLPSAFNPSQGERPEAARRTMAAWRELNRFMLPSEHRRTLFDVCYLVDGTPQGTQARILPQEAVFPMLSSAICTLLDENVWAYHKQARTNSFALAAKAPDTPFYSTIGLHTAQVPYPYLVERLAYRLAIGFLEAWLRPLYQEDWHKRAYRLDPTSPYNPSRLGREEAFSILTSPHEYEGQTESPTLFFAHLLDIVSQGGTDNVSLVQQHSHPGSAARWISIYLSLPDSPECADLNHRLRTAAALRVQQVVRPSRDIGGDPRDFARQAERRINQFGQEYYGDFGSPESHRSGKFGGALQECEQSQLAIFRHQVLLWLLNTLMEGNQSGRLGYAIDLLNGLINVLDCYHRFVQLVQSNREGFRLSQQVESDLLRATQEMVRYSSRRFPALLPIWKHPKAHASQVRYLEAVQEQIDLRKQSLLLNSICQVVESMRSHCAQVVHELMQWAIFLAVDDPAGSSASLLSVLQAQQREAETRFSQERSSLLHTTLTPDTLHDANHVETPRFRVEWQVKPNDWKSDRDQELHLSLAIIPDNDKRIALRLPDASSSQADQTGQEATALLRSLYPRAEQMVQSSSVRLTTSSHSPEELGQLLLDKAAPFFHRARGAELGSIPPMRFLCLGLGPGLMEDQKYLRQLEYSMNRLVGSDSDVRITPLGVPGYGMASSRATLLWTESVIPPERFEEWNMALRDCFEQLRSAPLPQYVFPAEINASRYELSLYKKTGRNRILHPRVVELLQDPGLLVQFLLCWALRWIQGAEATSPTKDTILSVSSSASSTESILLVEARREPVSPLQLIQCYVQVLSNKKELFDQVQERIGAERRTVGPSVWAEMLRREHEAPSRKGSFLAWLRSYAEGSLGRRGHESYASGASTQVYQDLGDLLELLLEELLGQYKTSLSQSPLQFDTVRFLREAGYSVVERPAGHLLATAVRRHSPVGYTQPFCVQAFADALRIEDIERLYRAAVHEYSERVQGRLVVAVVDHPPSSAALAHVYGYRVEKGLAFIVLSSSVMRRALAENRCPMEMGDQIRQILGRENLYSVSTPIADFLNFFGRAALIEEILQTLRRGEHAGVFGLRKMGKTSLMWQLREQLVEYPVAYVDTQLGGGVARALYPRIIRELAQDISAKHPEIVLPVLQLTTSSLGPATLYGSAPPASEPLAALFEQDIRALYEALRRRITSPRLFLFLDEAERIFPVDLQTESDRAGPGNFPETKKAESAEEPESFADWESFWATLRGIAQRYGFLGLLITAVDARVNRIDRCQGRDNPAYRLFSTEVFIPPFSLEEEREMIVNIGGQMGLTWSPTAVEAVHAASGGHPFISREICSLVARKHRGTGRIHTAQVEHGVARWLAGSNNYARQLWESRLTNLERSTLSSLANGQPQDIKELTAGYPLEQLKDAREAVGALGERSIIRQDADGYRIAFGVLRTWIRENILGITRESENEQPL